MTQLEYLCVAYARGRAWRNPGSPMMTLIRRAVRAMAPRDPRPLAR